MESLRRTCVEKLLPAWNCWSYHYLLKEEDALLFANVPGGNKAVTGDRCIFDFFLKKSRGSTVVPNYDFSSVLEVLLHLSGAFCEKVNDHHLYKENNLPVCRFDNQ